MVVLHLYSLLQIWLGPKMNQLKAYDLLNAMISLSLLTLMPYFVCYWVEECI